MRRYATADEQAVRTASRVRDWTESRLLDPERAKAIEQELQTPFRRTNRALRAVLFIFAAFVVLSAVGLVFVLIGNDEEAVAAALALMAGVVAFGLADVLIARFHLYRFGVEEACAVCAIGLLAGGATVGLENAGLRDDWLPVVALVVAALAAVVAYWRFGLLYCAIAAGACAASVPFFLAPSEMWARIFAVAILGAIHVVSGRLREGFGEDHPGDDYGFIESASWLGVYAVLNLKLGSDFLGVSRSVPAAFYWATYVAVWIVPFVGLYRGVRAKHHGMIRASLLMALGTIVTNKSYLGWERHAWDPIGLGLLLTGIALAVRRWLSLGPDGQRHGFTAHRLLSSDQRSVEQVALATAALKPDEAVRESSGPDAYKPGGGASGGAGASSRF